MNEDAQHGVYVVHQPEGKRGTLYRIVYLYDKRELLLEDCACPEAPLTPITAKDLRSKEWRSVRPAA